jgi:AraC-like DNA-binding protein
VNRKNGTSILITYRELRPSRELLGHVRAYYSFVRGAPAWRNTRAVTHEVFFTRDDSFCSPRFADGRSSLVIDLGATCDVANGWRDDAPVCARVIGALRKVGAPAGNTRAEMLGVYFEPGASAELLGVPAPELTDQAVDLDGLWGGSGTHLAADLAELDEPARVDRLEAVLLDRLRRHSPRRRSIDVLGLAHWAHTHPASMTVGALAQAAGVSRQHLTRVFREVVGVSPKRYCRLTRFQAGLRYAGAGSGVRWAEVAADLGYADQSHMIAEFRELSSLTPEALATGRWFHPFILEARARASAKR